MYRGITVDPATGAVDAHVVVAFKDLSAMAADYPSGPTDWWGDLR
jgi:hypothetical protein